MFGFFSPDDDEPDIPPETNELLTFLADAADEALDTFPPDELSMVRILLDTLDETEVPKPTNPYCKKGNDKDFPKRQSPYFEWINHPDYGNHICKDFKLSWWIRLGLRKHYKEGGY